MDAGAGSGLSWKESGKFNFMGAPSVTTMSELARNTDGPETTRNMNSDIMVIESELAKHDSHMSLETENMMGAVNFKFRVVSHTSSLSQRRRSRQPRMANNAGQSSTID